MVKDIDNQREQYIEQATRIATGELEEPSEVEISQRIQFWQSLTDEDRIHATTEIVRRVHVATGGNTDDLRVDKTMTRLTRREV